LKLEEKKRRSVAGLLLEMKDEDGDKVLQQHGTLPRYILSPSTLQQGEERPNRSSQTYGEILGVPKEEFNA
jgi:hypothetical protein